MAFESLRQKMDVHYSSLTNEWGTPWPFFRRLDVEFNFDLDPCATAKNAKCARFHTVESDGLAQPWNGAVFCNPPYGSALGAWVEKAYRESRHEGTRVVMLIPARTDTGYWHEFVMRATELRFVSTRLHFDGIAESGHNAPFPSVVVIFDPRSEGPPIVSSIDKEARPLERTTQGQFGAGGPIEGDTP